MKKMLVAIAAGAALVSTLAGPALAFSSDGKLPMYPGAKLDPKESSVTPNAIAQGVPLVIETSDSVRTVDAWYASNVPKACTRSAQGAAVKYACPGGSIMIYVHGGTQIALVPPLGGMFHP